MKFYSTDFINGYVITKVVQSEKGFNFVVNGVKFELKTLEQANMYRDELIAKLTPKRSEPKVKQVSACVTFNTQTKLWENIEAKEVDLWQERFPKIEVNQEMINAAMWYSEKGQGQYKNLKAFIIGWLTRSNSKK